MVAASPVSNLTLTVAATGDADGVACDLLDAGPAGDGSSPGLDSTYAYTYADQDTEDYGDGGGGDDDTAVGPWAVATWACDLAAAELGPQPSLVLAGMGHGDGPALTLCSLGLQYTLAATPFGLA